jgi:hypothetical protein
MWATFQLDYRFWNSKLIRRSMIYSKPSPSWPQALRVALIIYLPLRLGISLLVALLVWLVPNLAVPPRAELMAKWDIPVPGDGLSWLLLTPWLRFDALWFLKTALHGYELAETNIQHLPLFPALVRLVYEIMGGHIGWSAIIVTNGAFILGLAYFYRLVRLDYSEWLAWRAVIYQAIFPTVFYFMIGYSESLFWLGAVGAFYYARQRNWLGAGLLGVVSALSRPQGFLIWLPLMLEFWQQQEPRQRGGWLKAWPLLLIPLSVSLYALYLHLTFGLQTAVAAYNAYWPVVQPGWRIPGQGLWLNLNLIFQGRHLINNLMDLVFALFGLALSLWAMRRLRPSYASFMVLNMLVAISKPLLEYPLLGTPRFVLPLFPGYILLAQVGEKSPLAHRLIIYASLGLLIFFTAQFALGGWVA